MARSRARLTKLEKQLLAILKDREGEEACPACGGGDCQRLLLEGEPALCEVCGKPVAAVVIREVVVETVEDVRRALAEAAAAGVEVLGPLAHHASEDAPESYQTISNCTFSGNTAYAFGGGIYEDLATNLTVSNCTIFGNSTDIDYRDSRGGGGIYSNLWNG
jgi:predicted outer membrane repeat protein